MILPIEMLVLSGSVLLLVFAVLLHWGKSEDNFNLYKRQVDKKLAIINKDIERTIKLEKKLLDVLSTLANPAGNRTIRDTPQEIYERMNRDT